jgi:GH24 family phage-related lysozyme (muramidase)
VSPSGAGVALIQGFEGCRLTAYLPTANDEWTVGWGETGPHIGEATVWTQGQADARFAARLGELGHDVSTLIAAPTSQPQFDAMVSLAWNIGLLAFAGSTLLRLHNGGDFAAAAAQFVRWKRQRGVVLPGLIRRRQAEAAMYRGAGGVLRANNASWPGGHP